MRLWFNLKNPEGSCVCCLQLWRPLTAPPLFCVVSVLSGSRVTPLSRGPTCEPRTGLMLWRGCCVAASADCWYDPRGSNMDLIWLCCRILLFLSVCVNSSFHDGDDASCDGAFDIYFVLDRWVDTDVSVCTCVFASGNKGTNRIGIFLFKCGDSLTQSSPCMAVFRDPSPSAASLQVWHRLFESFLKWASVFGL